MSGNRTYLAIFLAFVIITGTILWRNRKADPIIVGYSADLSGRMSELGISGRSGIQTAVEIINERGGIHGRPIKLIVEDDKNTPEGALEADRKLVKRGAVAIIGHMVSGVMPLTLKYINSQNVLMISPTISDEALSRKDDNFLRIIDTNASQGKALAERAYSMGCRNVVALYEWKNRAYAGGVCNSFIKRFRELGGNISGTHTYTAGPNTDFGSLAKKLMQSKPDGIVAVTSGLEEAILCQQLSKMNSAVPVFAGMWASTQDLIQQGGAHVSRMHVAGTFDAGNKNPAYLQFKKDYQARFRKDPDFGADYAYEAAMVLFEGFRNAKSLRAADVKTALLRIKKFKGLQSDFKFDKYGDSSRPYKVFSVRRNHFVPEE